MASWYKDKVNDHIDVNQAVRDAGKSAEAVSYLASGVKQYADTQYAKKQAKLTRADKASGRSNKVKVARINAGGEIKAARIRAGAKVKGHEIDYDKERYKTDGAYKKVIDGKLLDIKKQKIASSGRVKVASISASAKDRATNVSKENNIRTTRTSVSNNQRSTNATNAQTQVSAENNIRTNKTKAKFKLKDDGDFTYRDLKNKTRKDLE